jgi:Protein of unknown function (DUF2905)
MAKVFLVLGGLFTFLGLLLYFVPDSLRWVGRLPGDIHIKKGNLQVNAPLATGLLVSLLVSLLFRFLRK